MPATPRPRRHAAARRGRSDDGETTAGAGAAMAITEQQILDALRRVRDREKGRDTVPLGLVSGVVVRDGNVGSAIEVEPSRGAHLEPLRKQAEQAVEALPGVLSVTAVLAAETGAGAGAGRGAPPGAPQGARPAAAPNAGAQQAPQGRGALAP